MEPPNQTNSQKREGKNALKLALALTLAFLVVELVAARLSNSLALFSDATHMVTDVAALAIAIFALHLGTRAHNAAKSFGYHRVEILAALSNALILWIIVAYIGFEAFNRFRDPQVIDGFPMLIIGFTGILVNVTCAALLARSSLHSLNVQGAFLHVLADAIGSVGVLVGGSLVLFFGWQIADQIISLFICVLILISSSKLIWNSVNVLLEGTPTDINLLELKQTIAASDGVIQVHDIHAWTLTSGYNAMTAHLVVKDTLPSSDREKLLDNLRHGIPNQFSIHHMTIQIESSSHCCLETHLPDGSSSIAVGTREHEAE